MSNVTGLSSSRARIFGVACERLIVVGNLFVSMSTPGGRDLIRESTIADRGIKGAQGGTRTIGDEDAAGSSDDIVTGGCCGLLTVFMLDIYRHELEANEKKDRGTTSLVALQRTI